LIRIPYALLLFGLTLAPATAAMAEPRAGLDIPYQKYVLSNGLTLLVHEDAQAPLVAVSVWYRVGSRDERPGRSGFAHLFEHLMFNGSANQPDGVHGPLRRAGATGINGSTAQDRTNFYQNVPLAALDLTLWLEADRMGHLLGALDQRKLDAQRRVVQNEKRQRENRPYGQVLAALASNTYPAGHPYSWLPIGSMADLEAATLDEAKEWFGAWYGAANAVLVVAGDVEAEQVKRQVEHFFGPIPAGPAPPRYGSWIAKMSGEKRLRIHDRAAHARLYKVWNIPGAATRDSALLEIVADVLGGGRNSRMYRHLVHERQLAVDVHAAVVEREIGGQFRITATARSASDIAAIDAAIDRELSQLLQSGPTDAELRRYRISSNAALARTAERIGVDGKSGILAEGEIYSGSPSHYAQWLHWTQTASSSDVRQMARQWLSDGVFVLEVQPQRPLLAAPVATDRSTPPAVGTSSALRMPLLQHAVLGNGLKIALAERPGAPILRLQLIFDAGLSTDAQIQPGVARLTAALLTQGTRTHDELQLANRLDELGATLTADSSPETTTLTLDALPENVPDSLRLFADVAQNPAFTQAEIERQRVRLIARSTQQRNEPQAIADRLLPQLVFGAGHPYAALGRDDIDALAAIGAEELRTFHRRWMRPDNATLLIVGGATLDSIMPLLERTLGAWRKPREPLPQQRIEDIPRNGDSRVFLVDQPGVEQSVIAAGHVLEPYGGSDYAALAATHALLDTTFLGRINNNLRQDKNWAYKTTASLQTDRWRPGLLRINAPVQIDKTAAAIREILGELRAARPIGDQEVREAGKRLALTLPASFQTVADASTQYRSMLRHDLPASYFHDYARHASTLTAQQLQGALAQIIRPSTLTWLVVTDLARSEAALRELGLGAVTILDADGNVVP